jgi:hypothetical protein
MMNRLLVLFLFVCIAAQAIYAQPGSSEDELSIMKRMTGLTAEHKFLNTFAGTWKIKGINYTGMASEAVVGKANVKNIMNDRYLEINLELQQSLGSSLSRIVIGFDTRYDKFTFFSIDDYSNFGLNCSGIKKENKLIFEGKDYSLFYKKDLPFRIEIERERENKFSYKVFYKMKNKDKLMIEYYFFKQ